MAKRMLMDIRRQGSAMAATPMRLTVDRAIGGAMCQYTDCPDRRVACTIAYKHLSSICASIRIGDK